MKQYLLLSILVTLLFNSKSQTITTVAGGNGQGSAANQLKSPTGIFVDPTGDLYVSDSYNSRIQKFSPNSNSTTNGVTVAGGNGQGSAANQLNEADGICVDNVGNVYIADGGNNRLQKFLSGSSSATNGITLGANNGVPTGVFVDNGGNLYVTEYINNAVLKFPAGSDSSTVGTIVAGGNGSGSDSNHLNGPYGIFVDVAGYVYIADRGNNRIQKFPPNSDSSTNGATIAGGNGVGTSANQLDPSGLYLDRSGNIYVSDGVNNRIQKFLAGSNSTTNAITIVGDTIGGSGMNQLSYPNGIYVDTNGAVYIADGGNNRIQKWSPTTNGISTISTTETISLYPNPNSGSFILQSSGSIGREYTVYDMIGRVVMKGNITYDKQNIALEDIAMGLYTLEVLGCKAIRFVIEN